MSFADRANGFVRAFKVPEWRGSLSCGPFVSHPLPPWNSPLNEWQHNDLLYDADTIMAQLLRGSPDGKAYHIGGFFAEFDNSGADVNPVPTVGRDENLSYYNGLNAGDADRDYLRIPLISTQLSSTNTANWPLGNEAEFSAQTAGATGVHGNTFSDVAGSRVYGGALVSFVDSGDSAQDLVFARFYFAPGSQIVKVAGSQIGVTWKYAFT